MHLVPLDLIGGEDRYEVVDVARARDEDAELACAVVAERAAAAARLHDVPGADVVAGGLEELVRLTEDDELDVEHLVRQARRRVREGRQIGHVREGAEVEARAAEGVRLLERADAYLARRPQERVVRCYVEADLLGFGLGRTAIHC